MFFTHEFAAPLERFGVGKSRKVWYRVVFLPAHLEADLPFDQYPRLRVDAELEDVPVNGAWMPTGDGRRYLIVGPAVIKATDLRLGDPVSVRFKIADQDYVDVPPKLLAALEGDSRLTALWDELTPGKKRALSHHVASAKTEPTQDRRVEQVLVALENNQGRLR
ncbi:MAG: YdeI/OmpD-associated family protein [Pseudomonadota bacterium]